jgi:hypothetical protein
MTTHALVVDTDELILISQCIKIFAYYRTAYILSLSRAFHTWTTVVNGLMQDERLTHNVGTLAELETELVNERLRHAEAALALAQVRLQLSSHERRGYSKTVTHLPFLE